METDRRFSFDEDQFNKLFPFFVLFDSRSTVVRFGRSIARLCPIEAGLTFSDLFVLKRPELDGSVTLLSNLLDQVVILTCKWNKDLTFRGQFEYISGSKEILFVGTPWFNSASNLVENGLSINDFAIHDSMIDLLHVLKTQEIITDEMKVLLNRVNHQKNILKSDQVELKRRENMLEAISLATNELLSNKDFFEAVRECLPMLGKAVGVNRIQLFENDRDNFQDTTTSLRLEWTGDESVLVETVGALQQIELKSILGNAVNILRQRNPFKITRNSLSTDSLVVPVFQQEMVWGFVVFDDYNSGRVWSEADMASLKSFSNSVSHALVRCKAEKESYDTALLVTENPDPVIRVNFAGKVLLQNAAAELIDYFIVGDYKLSSNDFFYFLCRKVSDNESLSSYEAISGERTYFVTPRISKSNGYINIYASEITEKKKAELKLSESEKRVSSLVLNLQTGILVEDENRDIAICNKVFCDLFNIPASPESMMGINCANAAEETKTMFKNPQRFVKRISQILEERKVVLSEQLELIDGRILARDYVPIFVGDEYKGHLWKYTDITGQKKHENNLRKQEEKYRSIIENMKLGLTEMNLHDEVQFTNLNFSEMSGYPINELMHKNVYEFLLEPDSAWIFKEKSKLRKKGISDRYEISIRTKRGDQRTWLISEAPAFNDEGELTGSTAIHLDITRQKRLEQALRSAKSKAEESSKAKESFLANMSHEIRTPLNAIIGLVRELNRSNPTATQQVYLKHTESASQHLLSIINDVLDISKIEAGQLHLEQRNFSLQKVLQETIDIMEPIADGKSIDLHYTIDDRVAPVFVGDPNRIRQILLNLISNSVKFTERGSVTLSCKIVGRLNNTYRVQIDVKDTGIGMDKSFLKSLFKKFTQEDLSVVRKYGGTGLGMAITSELVHLMGGTIEVSSEKGVGTNFCVTLPLVKGDEEFDIELHEDTSLNLEKLKILLVEDNELNRLVATTSLARNGAELTHAVNGVEAIEILKTMSFDLILMDIQMPVMGGQEATMIIRNELKLQTPIIALTANAFKAEIQKCIEVGMNDYVTKPFDEAVLFNVIRKNVDRKMKIVVESNVPQESISEGRLYDLSAVVRLSHGDQNFVREFVQLFCKITPDCIDALQKAFSSGDDRALNSAAHKMKPMIDNMGISSLKDDIRLLECVQVNEGNGQDIERMIQKIVDTLKEVISSAKAEYEE